MDDDMTFEFKANAPAFYDFVNGDADEEMDDGYFDPKFQANAIEEHDEENEPEEDLNAADAVADDQPQLCETTEFVVSQKSQQSSSGARWMQPTKASSARLNANSSKSRIAHETSSIRSEVARPQLTVPQSPKFNSTARTRGADRLTATSRELQQIAKAKKAKEAQKRKWNRTYEQTMKRSAAPPTAPTSVRSSKPLTLPKTPALRSATRSRTAAVEQQTVPPPRPPRDETSKRQKGPTVPKPFRLSTDTRASRQPTATTTTSEYVSVAEATMKFQSKTPKRFHSKGRNQAASPAPHHELKLTAPQEFKFHSTARSRATDYVPKEKLEEEELKNIKPFKALPLNPKILESAGDLGVPKVPKRALTVPEEFNFATTTRTRTESTAVDETSETKPVHKPKPRAAGSLTEPKTPMLQTKVRSALRPAAMADPTPDRKFKANPMPDYNSLAQQHTVEVKHRELTEPQPFHLRGEELHQRYRQEFEAAQAAEAVEAKKRSQFHAHGIPAAVYTGPQTTTKTTESRPITVAKEFHLESVKRHQEAQTKFAQMTDAQKAEELRRRQFHAQGLPVTTYEPELVAARETPLTTVPDPVHFHTDDRASAWNEMGARRKEKEAQLQAELQAKQLAEAAQNEEENKRVRGQTAFKATAVRKYKPASVNLDTKPLTQPFSPALQTKLRSQQKAQL